MLIRIDSNSSSSSDGSKIADAFYLLKNSGVVSSKVSIDKPTTETAEELEAVTKDSPSRIFDLFSDGNDYATIPVYNSVYIDTLSLDILSPYSENSKICVLTSLGFYKAFDIGEKMGTIEINLMEGESPSDENYITTSGFPVINTSNGYRPKFINFNSYSNPLTLGIKIVGNDKSSASAVVKCIAIPC